MINDTAARIRHIRDEWGPRLLLLGHHYQRATVLRHADEWGDSLELARKAASHPEAERIVFCGVRFMAESADILTDDQQAVYMPELTAGCPMANMADAVSMQRAMSELDGYSADWLPVVYVNSSADVKACCGSWGGSACTSSNARRVFEWAISKQKRILFLPDEHLGVNTARDLGMDSSEVVVYDPTQPRGGLSDADLDRARVAVWKGYCIVHQAFTVQHVMAARRAVSNARIIVHPESPKAVVEMADAHGSTSQIIRYVETAPDGATIFIGTEQNLVLRLAEEHADRVTVKALWPSVCANMAKTNEQNLLHLLETWPTSKQVRVPAQVAMLARLCLETMLSL